MKNVIQTADLTKDDLLQLKGGCDFMGANKPTNQGTEHGTSNCCNSGW